MAEARDSGRREALEGPAARSRAPDRSRSEPRSRPKRRRRGGRAAPAGARAAGARRRREADGGADRPDRGRCRRARPAEVAVARKAAEERFSELLGERERELQTERETRAKAVAASHERLGQIERQAIEAAERVTAAERDSRRRRCGSARNPRPSRGRRRAGRAVAEAAAAERMRDREEELATRSQPPSRPRKTSNRRSGCRRGEGPRGRGALARARGRGGGRDQRGAAGGRRLASRSDQGVRAEAARRLAAEDAGGEALRVPLARPRARGRVRPSAVTAEPDRRWGRRPSGQRLRPSRPPSRPAREVVAAFEADQDRRAELGGRARDLGGHAGVVAARRACSRRAGRRGGRRSRPRREQVGCEVARQRRDDVLDERRRNSPARPRRHRHVDASYPARRRCPTRRRPGPGIERALVDARVEHLGRDSQKICSVPLPWWTSQSRIRTRSAPCAASACAAATATLLNRQKPIARVDSA